MADTKADRTERREEIKLRLEYLKVAIEFGVPGTLVFAALQWQATTTESVRRANQIADEAVYHRFAAKWTDHLRTMVDKSNLRP